MISTFLARATVAASLLMAVSCSSSRNTQPNQGGQWTSGGQTGYGQGSYGQGGTGGTGGRPTTTSAPPANQLPPPGLPVLNDPINLMDMNTLKARSTQILNELVASLPSGSQSKVSGIPLAFEAGPVVNAYAGCQQGRSFMALTEGIIEVSAFGARYRANDELFGGNRLEQYAKMVAQSAKAKGPLARPGVGFVDPVQDTDNRKVSRQNVLFDAEIAFVLGHELAHHYLGHTGCANGAPAGITLGDLGRVLSNTVPVFNQPNEIGADMAGTYNLLALGARRPAGSQINEAGAMLTLNFFLAMRSGLSPADILFAFEASHPHPSLRMPIVQQAANTWRQSGGNPPPILGM